MLDILLLVILVIAAIWGFAKGMIKVLFSLGGYVVAFLIARRYSANLAEWLVDFSSWDDTLSESINTNLQTLVGDGVSEVAAKFSMQDIATMPEFTKIRELAQGFASDAFSSNLEAAELGLDFSLAGDTFAYYVLLAVSAILLFIGVKLLLGIVGALLHNLLSLSDLLNATDRVIGLILGSVVGILVVFFVVSVMAPISLTFVGVGLVDLLQESRIATFIIESGLYQNLMVTVTGSIAGIRGA